MTGQCVKSSGIRPRQPRDVIGLSDVWRCDSSAWLPGEAARIIAVEYQHGPLPMLAKVKVERAPDGSYWLRCPLCGEHCPDLCQSRRGLACGCCAERTDQHAQL